MSNRNPVTDNPWKTLRAFTDARIGLGRAGISLPTHELLAFQLAHAQAQDAVHQPLDTEQLSNQLTAAPLPFPGTPLALDSQASDRRTYLQRPDLGRRLHARSQQQLQAHRAAEHSPYDLAVVIADGLSSRAIQSNTEPFLLALSEELQQDPGHTWSLAPLTLIRQGRVAVGDDVGEALNANAVLVMIGERPGLSSPDSLGLYLTWNPRRGTTDASRNCISNVRPAGLSASEASRRLLYLLQEARRRQLTGVQLKDESDSTLIEPGTTTRNFLLSN